MQQNNEKVLEKLKKLLALAKSYIGSTGKRSVDDE